MHKHKQTLLREGGKMNRKVLDFVWVNDMEHDDHSQNFRGGAKVTKGKKIFNRYLKMIYYSSPSTSKLKPKKK